MRAAAVVLMLLLTANGCPADPPAKPAPTKKCAEGDACWDCKTMGNKRCGTPDPARQELA